jgi:hypothetical protein
LLIARRSSITFIVSEVCDLPKWRCEEAAHRCSVTEGRWSQGFIIIDSSSFSDSE